MEIIAGTYEGILVGYRFERSEGDDEFVHSELFNNRKHTGFVRAVACSNKYLVSGGSDESINIYDLKKQKEIGTLFKHEGTISCLEFYGGSYLLSAADDGRIIVWKCKTWTCEKTLLGHEGKVLALAIHPSGKLALSSGEDKTLRTWNLIKGRKAYIVKLPTCASVIKWNPSGDQYAVVRNNEVDVYGVESTSVIFNVKHLKSVLCLEFLKDDYIAFGGEDKTIEIHCISTKSMISKLSGHNTRIKGLVSYSGRYISEDDTLLFSTSSDGCIKLWKFTDNDFSTPRIAMPDINTGCRVLSICLHKQESELSNKSKPKNTLNLKEEVKNGLESETKLEEAKGINSSGSDGEDAKIFRKTGVIENKITKKKNKRTLSHTERNFVTKRIKHNNT